MCMLVREQLGWVCMRSRRTHSRKHNSWRDRAYYEAYPLKWPINPTLVAVNCPLIVFLFPVETLGSKWALLLSYSITFESRIIIS